MAPRLPKHIESVDDAMAVVLRSKSGPERLAIAGRMFVMAREMLLASLCREHPDWSPDRVQREAARRLSHGAL